MQLLLAGFLTIMVEISLLKLQTVYWRWIVIFRVFILGWVVFFAVLSGPVFSHSPLLMCYDEGDGTILCEGGWSDGSCASCTPVYVIDQETGSMVACGMLDRAGFFEFDKPGGAFVVLFDGGQGHTLELLSSEIIE